MMNINAILAGLYAGMRDIDVFIACELLGHRGATIHKLCREYADMQSMAIGFASK